VTKDAQSPQWPGCRDGTDMLLLKLRCNKRSAYIERLTSPSLKRRPHLETCTCLGENRNLGHRAWGKWCQEWLLAKASSNLTDWSTYRQSGPGGHGLLSRVSCVRVTTSKDRSHWTTEVEDSVGSRYLAGHSEDTEDMVHAVVNCKECELLIVL
jgi:hypothetical protein